MMHYDANVREAERMLNLIAERSGEDRASVFLDILIQMIFTKEVHSYRNNDDPSVRRSQQVLNEIAAIYNIQAPTLKNVEGKVDDPNEIPF